MNRTVSEIDDHRSHAFTLPTAGTVIVSANTGIAYIIGKKFNQGGFGHVYECEDEWMHSLVAKVLQPVGLPEDMEARAISESLAMAIGRSPNIVHIHDAFVFKGAYYIISQRCAMTLRDMMQRETFEPRIWFASLARTLLNAVHMLHVRGLAHCDLHPGNVFWHLQPDTLLPQSADHAASGFKVGDFGLARPIESMVPSGTFHPSFRPPEAIDPDRFGPIDQRSDIYQAGLLLVMFFLKREWPLTIEDIIAGKPREMA
jgi:serine/threonine protein kinase